MSEKLMSNASYSSKQSNKLPEGAEIIKKSYSINVQEIENGFIIRKSYDIEYIDPIQEGSKYTYITKEWYSKKNPMNIDIKEEIKLEDKL